MISVNPADQSFWCLDAGVESSCMPSNFPFVSLAETFRRGQWRPDENMGVLRRLVATNMDTRHCHQIRHHPAAWRELLP